VSIGWYSYACLLITTNPNPKPRVIYGLSRTALTSNQGGQIKNQKEQFLQTSVYYVEMLASTALLDLCSLIYTSFLESISSERKKIE
jgi:hypothetical protein